MSDQATPRQGDHVFNALETAILRPFETIRSFRSPDVDGQHFIHSFLLHSYSLAKQTADNPIFSMARQFVASAGAEDTALREISRLCGRFPALARVSGALLRDVHLQNANQFGSAAERFEVELLSALQQALEAAVARADAPAPQPLRAPSPGIAYQQMLNAAYDPAAALVVITNSMSRESGASQGTFHSFIAALAHTLDRPGMWKDPYRQFKEDRKSPTGDTISGILDVLIMLDSLKAPGVTFANWVRDEIAIHARSMQAAADYGPMLYLVHMRLQQMRGPGE